MDATTYDRMIRREHGPKSRRCAHCQVPLTPEPDAGVRFPLTTRVWFSPASVYVCWGCYPGRTFNQTEDVCRKVAP